MVTHARAGLRVELGTVLSRRLETEQALPAPSHGLQNQVDALVSRFVDEAASPITLCSLMAGSLAYRWGRIGVMGSRFGQVLNLPLQRPLSIGVGLGAEVTAFEFTNRTLHTLRAGLKPAPTSHFSPLPSSPNLWSWSGPGGWKEGLLSSLICFGALKGAGYLGREQNQILQHAFQSAAMVAGQNTASRLGIIPTPTGDLAEQLLHAEAINLQLRAGMSMVSSLAPRFSSMERGLDLQLKTVETGNLFSAPPYLRPAWAATGLSASPELRSEKGEGLESLPRRNPQEVQKLVSQPLAMEGGGEGRSGETDSERLKQWQKLSKTFEAPLKNLFTHSSLVNEILDAAMEIPPRLKNYRHHFLASLTHSRLTDPVEAYLMILAVRDVFQHEALHSSKGSYHEALIQLFVESALTDADSSRTGFALRSLYQALGKGPSPTQMEDLIEQYEYGREYRMTAEERATEQARLIREYSSSIGSLYSAESVQTAADFAAHTRFPKVLLGRLEAVLKSQDHPAKILELREVPPADQGRSLTERLQEIGSPKIIDEINGTHLTAFLRDRQLALMVASVLSTEFEYRIHHPEAISESLRRLEQKIEPFLRGWKGLQPIKFLDFLTVNSGDPGLQIARDWGRGKFEIEILSSTKFEEKIQESSGDLKGNLVAVIERPQRPPLFVIRDLPYGDLDTREQYYAAFLGVTDRLSNFVQKWALYQQLYLHEHLKALGPLGEEDPHPSHSRLSLRMMAALEMQRWRLINGLALEWNLADRVGGIVPHLRNYVESLISKEGDPL